MNNFKVSFHLCDTFKVGFNTHGPPTFILHAKGLCFAFQVMLAKYSGIH
jgi:hypothetical protein